MREPGERARWWGIAAALAALALLAYLPWLGNPFHFDDRISILDNTEIRSVRASLESVLRSPNRGVTMLGYALVHAVTGHDPRGYHAAGLLLHLLMSGLVGMLASRLSGGSRAAGVMAFGIFLLHPLNSEAVLYISSQPDLLAGILALLCARLLWKGWRLPALLAALAAVLAKESGVVAWFLGILLVAWEGRLPWRRLALTSALAALAAVAAYGAYLDLSIVDLFYGGPLRIRGWLEHQGMQVRIHAWYLLPRLLMPFRLCLSPGPPLAPAGSLPLGLLLLSGLSALGIWGWRRGGLARLGALALAWWFLGQAVTTLVVLSDPVVEHRAYLAMAGPAAFGGAILERVLAAFRARGRSAAGEACLAALAVLFAARDRVRGADYRGEERLWREVVRDAPSKPGARLNLGRAYDEEDGDWQRAVRQYAIALPRTPPGFQAMILNNIANLQLRQGNYVEAERTHAMSLRLNPGHPDVRMNHGISLIGAGRREEGERELEAVARDKPRHGASRRALASALRKRGDLEGARRWFLSAVEVEPDLSEAWVDLALVEIELKDYRSAQRHLEEGTRRCRHIPEVWDVLGYAYYAGKDLVRAEAACLKALEMNPGAWRTRVTLAAILANRGDLAGAAACYREALKSAPDNELLKRGLAGLEARMRAH